MELQREIKLRLDEHLETLVSWLNSKDAVRYRHVISGTSIYHAYDDTGLGALRRIDRWGGPEQRHDYRQGLMQYGPIVSCSWGEIQYDLFEQKNGVIATIRWVGSTDGAVWDLLEKIAMRWPETQEAIEAWQASDSGRHAARRSAWEAWWRSPDVQEIRWAAMQAVHARDRGTRADWDAKTPDEQYEAVLFYFLYYTPEQVAGWGDYRRVQKANGYELISRQELEKWATLGDEERRAWIAEGGPCKLNEIAWDDLPEEERRKHEEAIEAWHALEFVPEEREEVKAEQGDENDNVPKREENRDRWRQVWQLWIDMKADYQDLWEQGQTDDPEPTIADLEDRAKSIEISYSKRTLRKIVKAGKRGELG